MPDADGNAEIPAESNWAYARRLKQVSDLREQRAALLVYLLSKVKANDLHAVQDAASDIREIDAVLKVLSA